MVLLLYLLLVLFAKGTVCLCTPEHPVDEEGISGSDVKIRKKRSQAGKQEKTISMLSTCVQPQPHWLGLWKTDGVSPMVTPRV